MRLATIRVEGRTEAVRIDGDAAVEVGATDVGTLLSDADWRRRARTAAGAIHTTSSLDFAPLVPRPSKIICAGLNYRAHILETGSPVPEYPTLFAKFAPALIGAFDDIALPEVVEQMDWEAELAVVVGARVERVDGACRSRRDRWIHRGERHLRPDSPLRTSEWLQGKTFARTTPLGPYLVTPEEVGSGHEITCEVDGELMQKANTVVFGAVDLVSYISTVLPLEPGDVILTGTPGGVGIARSPKRFLAAGEEVVTRISGIGECRNVCRRP